MPARLLGRELHLRSVPLTGLRLTLRLVAPALIVTAATVSLLGG
jgi:hypothetical protein